jgi:hypothetical protein
MFRWFRKLFFRWRDRGLPTADEVRGIIKSE